MMSPLFLVTSTIIMTAAAESATSASSSICYENPRQDICSSFIHPNSTTDMDNLCKAMPYMTGCSVSKKCRDSPGFLPEEYCKPFSVIADVCAADMPGMGGCKSWNALCGNPKDIKAQSTSKTPMSFSNTSVAQCKQEPPIPALPNTKKLNDQIKSICAEMTMDGCEKCTINPAVSNTYFDCDLLDVYVYLCQAMPDMTQCVEWKEFCAVNPELEYCNSNAEGLMMPPPAMKMFFHSGYTEYVMFQDWIPRNATQYWLSVLALIALSIVYEGLIALSALLESRWIQRDKAAACFPYKLRSSNNKISHGNANSGENGFASSSSSSVNGLYVASIRSILKFVSSTLGYAIMLVTMTFNWGLFFGVMIGLTIGTFLFSGLIRRAGIESKGAFDGSAATSATACC